MKIILQSQKIYHWYTESGVSVRGYFQSSAAPYPVYRDAEAVAYFAQADSFASFLSLLDAVDGVFSVIIDRGQTVWAAVDRARSMPLYYAVDGSAISDDSKLLREHLQIPVDRTDPLRMAELMATRVVSDRYTVYPEIRQLILGSAGEWTDGRLHTEIYYSHMVPTVPYSREAAKAALRRTAEQVFDRVIAAAQGRPIVLSLSGGYDSRFVACMLKERGAENVSCYTYGTELSLEVVASKKVAEALGYRWTCVTFADGDTAAQLDDARDYIDTCYQHDFVTYLQSYIAVKRLHEEGWIPENAVFLTGLCHDMPTGEYLMEERALKYPVSADGAAAFTLANRFDKFDLRSEAAAEYLADLRRQIDEMGKEIRTYQDFVLVTDVLNTGFLHSRCFLPMNYIHAYFGYEWMLPCWDRELLDYWYSLPYTFRIRQGLYEEWLMEDLCHKYNVDTKKIIQNHAPFPWLTRLIRPIGGIVAKFCYKTHTPLHLRTDINGGAALRQRLFDSICQKQAIKYSRASETLLMAIHLMERRYGTHFWNDVRKVLKK